ncbi:hypothetical protein G6F66_015362 [Rhizopus arrhizus]|nr:hypothetical protein G6F66_015362 [Rhizopus arrhizus]
MRAFLLEILHVGLALGYLALDEDVAGAVAGVARKLPVALLLRSSGNRGAPRGRRSSIPGTRLRSRREGRGRR